MTQTRGRIDWSPQGDQIGGGLIEGVKEGVKTAGKTMLPSAPKVGRMVLNRVPGLPGLVMDGAQLATTAAWVKAREAQIARGALTELQTYTRPPQARERF